MPPRISIKRVAALLGCATLCWGMGGCLPWSKSVRFTNVSKTWLNVRFYAGEASVTDGQPALLASRRAYQVGPGGSVAFSPSSKSMVHVQVEPVTASWAPAGRQYWLEVLTSPPVNVVASGDAGRLEFETGTDAIAEIPERERTSSRFEYTVAGAADGRGQSAGSP